jgi:hypothetical protein
MKKSIISTLAIALCAFGLTAQTTEFDAIKLAQTDISGTARYMGMAGAFGALGGDVSAIKDNPAGLGIYRSSEITTTLNFLTQRSNANWNGKTANDDLMKFGFNNVALVLSSSTWNSRSGNTSGLLQSNWGFSYNRLKNFNRNVTVQGAPMAGSNSITQYYADITSANKILESQFALDNDFDVLPWMSILSYWTFLINDNGGGSWSSAIDANETITPRYYLQESGHLDEFAISWGGNFSNTLFIGTSLNFQSINYSMRSDYIEKFGANENLDLTNWLRTTGAGISLDLGVIYRPVNYLRFGLAYKTPMRYSLTHTYSARMVSNLEFKDGSRHRFEERAPHDANARYNYETRTPARFTASAAGIIGQRAIISADMVYTNFRNIKMFDQNGNSR